MKKSLFLSAAALALLGSACSQDNVMPAIEGEGTLRISIPADLQSRYGQAATAPDLFVAIYNNADGTLLFSNFVGNEMNETDFTVGQFGDADPKTNLRTATVNVDLVKNQKYDIICWAQSPSVPDGTYTFDAVNKTIQVSYGEDNIISNYAEERDAFFGQELAFTSLGNGTEITLTRPFAQINVGTSDWRQYSIAGGDKTRPFGMTITGAATTLNLTDGSVSGTAEEITVTGAPAQEYATGNANNFPTNVGEYTYLDMAYVLVGDMGTEKGNLTVCLTGIGDYPAWTEVPAKMNYRTNIFGNLLTNPEDFSITLDPTFGYPNIAYTITSEADLSRACQTGGHYILTKDVTTKYSSKAYKNIPVSFDLNGHTLNLAGGYFNVGDGTQCTFTGPEGSAIIAPNVSNAFELSGSANLTIDGVNINYSNYSSGVLSIFKIQGNGTNLTVKNSVLTPAVYALTTNATDPNQSGNVTFENVTIKATPTSQAPMLINVPLTFTGVNCHFEGLTHAFFMRGGTYDFTNCSFALKLDIDENGNTTTVKDQIAQYRNKNNYRNANWGDGNSTIIAAVTMGNRSAANSIYYKYPTTVNMKGCTVTIPDVAKLDAMGLKYSLPAVYAYANPNVGDGVYFTYDATTTFNGAQEYASPNIFVNGVETQNYDFSTDEPK